MDEDDDFFDMRRRMQLDEKNNKRPKRKDPGSDSSDSDTSSSEESDHEIPIPSARPYTSCDLVDSSVAARSANKKRKVISLSSDEEESVSQRSASSPRDASLSPPPLLEPEQIRQAMALISDHVQPNNRLRTRQRSAIDDSPDNTSDADDDDFDLSAYQSAMNVGFAKDKVPKPKDANGEAVKILLVFQGQKRGEEKLPDSWETVLGLRVLSSTNWVKMRNSFRENKKYSGQVVFAWRGTRLWHGTPQDVGMVDQDRIDVFTEKGWKIFEVEKKTQESRRNLENLSEDEEDIPAPKQIALILQGPGVKVKLRVLETATIQKMAVAYRKEQKLPPEANITLSMDGDVLDDTQTVKSLALEDDDVLDVQVDN